MRTQQAVLALVVLTAMSAIFVGVSQAQAPARAATPPKAVAGKATAMPIQANLGQLMKGVFYPNSNVIFFAQSQDPAKVNGTQESSTATDPLQSAYGKWEAVENSALALTEVANLLTIPGRKCANGRDMPLRNADWAKLVQGVREAGMQAYKAAQAKDQDKILDAADTLTTACANCHDKYREKEKLADRCM